MKPEDTIFAVLSLATDLRNGPKDVDASQSGAGSEAETQYTARRLKALTTTVNLLRNRAKRKTYDVDCKISFSEVYKDFLYWKMPSNTLPKWSFGQDSTEKGLLVDGFILDMIEVKSLPAQQGNVTHEWLLTWAWKTPADLPPSRFWRTLVGDRGPDGENSPTYSQRACRHAYVMGVEEDDLRTERSIIEGYPDMLAGFLKRVQSVVWRRCMIKTNENKMLGLVPYDANETNLVCIL